MSAAHGVRKEVTLVEHAGYTFARRMDTFVPERKNGGFTPRIVGTSAASQLACNDAPFILIVLPQPVSESDPPYTPAQKKDGIDNNQARLIFPSLGAQQQGYRSTRRLQTSLSWRS